MDAMDAQWSITSHDAPTLNFIPMYNRVQFRDYPDPANVHILDQGALPMIADMHKFGIRVDVLGLQGFLSELLEMVDQMRADYASTYLGSYQYLNPTKKSHEPFNLASTDHVAQFLFEHLKVQGSDELLLTPTGSRFVCNDDVLEVYADHPAVKAVQDFREVNILRGTFAIPILDLARQDPEHRLHPKFNVTVVASGRLSASYVMTIPKRSQLGRRLRSFFVAKKGCVLFSADLSQIEMRWLAHLSGDSNMIEVFNADGDIHVRTACGVFDRDYKSTLARYRMVDALPPDSSFLSPDDLSWYKQFKNEERSPSKNVGFGVAYEITSVGLQALIVNSGGKKRDWPEDRCQTFIDGFYEEYGRIGPFQESQHRYATRYGIIIDAFGRPRPVPEARSSHKRIRNEGFRKSANHPVQGSAQGHIKLAMAEVNPVYRDIYKDFWCVPQLQIHDSINGEVDKKHAQEVADMTREIMEQAVVLDVPVKSSADFAETMENI